MLRTHTDDGYQITSHLTPLPVQPDAHYKRKLDISSLDVEEKKIPKGILRRAKSEGHNLDSGGSPRSNPKISPADSSSPVKSTNRDLQPVGISILNLAEDSANVLTQLETMKRFLKNKIKKEHQFSQEIEVDRAVDHMTDEIIDIVAMSPDEDGKGHILHYNNNLITAVERACILGQIDGYFPELFAHIRTVEAAKAANRTRYLDGIKKPFDLNNFKEVRITICYATEKPLQGKALREAIRCYVDKEISVVVYLGRDGGVSENIAKKEEWISENGSIIGEFGDKVKLLMREEFVLSPEFKKAEKFVAGISHQKNFVNALEFDVIARLKLKKFLIGEEAKSTQQKAKQSSPSLGPTSGYSTGSSAAILPLLTLAKKNKSPNSPLIGGRMPVAGLQDITPLSLPSSPLSPSPSPPQRETEHHDPIASEFVTRLLAEPEGPKEDKLVSKMAKYAMQVRYLQTSQINRGVSISPDALFSQNKLSPKTATSKQSHPTTTATEARQDVEDHYAERRATELRARA
jgi:hypothetical protein